MLDEESIPIATSKLAWEAWDDLLPLMQFYIGSIDRWELGKEDSGAKWGFFNFITGEIVVKPIYDYVYPFYSKLAQVIQNKKTGFINQEGKVLYGIIWDEARNFNNAAACAVRKDDLWGCMGLDGTMLLEPQFDDVGPWKIISPAQSKTAYSAFVKKNGKYGYIDDQGNYLVKPLFDDARDFWIGHYAPVKVYGKWGFIEQTGQFVVPPIFSEIGKEHSDCYVVCQDETWGILSDDLNIYLPEQGLRYVVFNGEKVYLKNERITSRRKDEFCSRM